MGIIRTQVKLLIFLPYLIGSTHHVTAKLDLPLIIFGPIGSNEIKSNVDFRKYTNDFDINTSERTAIIENIHIKSNVTKSVETTTIDCFIKNPSIRTSRQVAINIELPHQKYQIQNLTLQALGDEKVYTTAEKNNDDNVQIVYQRLLKHGQACVMIQEVTKTLPKSNNEETRSFALNANMPPEEKILVSITYRGSLSKEQNHTFRHTVHINPHQPVQNFNVYVEIFENLPIVDAHAVEMRNKLPVFNYSRNSLDRSSKESLKVTYKPNDIRSKTKESKFDMSGKFITTYSVGKTMLLNKVGEKIASFESNVENRKIVEYMLEYPLGFILESMIFVLFIIPLMILTEIKNGLVMIMKGPVAIDRYGNADYVGPFMLDHTTDKLENILEKLNVDEHPEKPSNLDQNVGIDIPSDRMATSFDDSEDTLNNAEGQLERNRNIFENWNILRAKKHEPSFPPMKLPKIFSWKATGSISFARSLSKSLLDLFEYYFGDVPGLGAPFILWDFFFREVLQGA